VSKHEESNEQTQASYLSPAVSRTIEILRLIAKNPSGVTLAKLCRESTITKNSIFRILNSLVLEGVLQRDAASQQFTMTGELLGIAYRGTGADALSQIVIEPMRQLRDQTGETVLFGKLLKDRGVVLEQMPGSFAIKVQVEIGVTFPLHVAAPAKAIMACLPLPEREKVCGSIEYPKFTANTITSAEALLAQLAGVEKSGIAYDRGEEIEDIRCVASAILDHRGSPVGALWLTGPASRLSDALLEEYGLIVREKAKLVSIHLGGT